MKNKPLPYTPRERFALESARGNNTKDHTSGDGELPTIQQYNDQVNSGAICGQILRRPRGMNW